MADLRFPLAWPAGHARTPAAKRRPSLFREESRGGYKRPPTTDEGRRRVEDELSRYARVQRSTVQISTNIELRRDGYPRADRRPPADPGVCVYFTLDGVPYALPCDRWETVGENLAAAAAHIGALRGIERWGVGTAKQHFAGFAALPAAGGTSKPRWAEVLGIEPGASAEQIRAAYRKRAMETHPDHGGSDDAFRSVQDALSDALREVSHV